jgi:hypothetical protein
MDISEAEWREWREYWARAPVRVEEFTNAIRWAIGKDPIPHGAAGKSGGRSYYLEGARTS